MQTWKITEQERAVHVIEFPLTRVGDEFRALAVSDTHLDSTLCRREAVKRDMDEALEIGAPVIDAGDFFDAMQGKYDSRSASEELMPELLHAREPDGTPMPYLKAMVMDGVDFMRPYAHILTVRGVGNHEDAIRQHRQWDVAQEFVSQMRSSDGPAARNIHLGGYHGWVVFRIKLSKTQAQAKILKYHHGWGGGGPVTRGVIQSARMSDWLGGSVDLIMSGHTHDEWRITRPKEDLVAGPRGYRSIVKNQIHFRVPGYKDEFQQKGGSFANRKGQGPKPIGGAWIRFRLLPGREVGVKVEETAWS